MRVRSLCQGDFGQMLERGFCQCIGLKVDAVPGLSDDKSFLKVVSDVSDWV